MIDYTSIPTADWMNYEAIYDMAADRLKTGDMVVELGVWKGRSITYLMHKLMEQGKECKITCVDNFLGASRKYMKTQCAESDHPKIDAIPYNQTHFSQLVFFLASAGILDKIDIVISESDDASTAFEDDSVSFCWVDACHYDTSVTRDITAWWPKIKSGGVISGHDWHWTGVNKAVKRYFHGVAEIQSYDKQTSWWVEK